jgi:hypothetical protein
MGGAGDSGICPTWQGVARACLELSTFPRYIAAAYKLELVTPQRQRPMTTSEPGKHQNESKRRHHHAGPCASVG